MIKCAGCNRIQINCEVFKPVDFIFGGRKVATNLYCPDCFPFVASQQYKIMKNNLKGVNK